jgi:hypothetical protein
VPRDSGHPDVSRRPRSPRRVRVDGHTERRITRALEVSRQTSTDSLFRVSRSPKTRATRLISRPSERSGHWKVKLRAIVRYVLAGLCSSNCANNSRSPSTDNQTPSRRHGSRFPWVRSNVGRLHLGTASQKGASSPALEIATSCTYPGTNGEYLHPANECGSGGGLRPKHRHTFSPCENAHKTGLFAVGM